MYKQKERNERLRKEVDDVIIRYGIKLIHLSNMTGLEYTNLSKWRNNKVDYSGTKLNKIEHFLGGYRSQY